MTFNEPLAYQHYNSFENDTQIGKAVGKSPNTIACWRRRKNLPSLYLVEKAKPTKQLALTPKQIRAAGAFLGALERCSAIAKQAGVQVDVLKCITAYRG